MVLDEDRQFVIADQLQLHVVLSQQLLHLKRQ